MKRNLVSLFVMLSIGVSLMAQDHLKFKGVPIDGTIESFVQKMRAAGFREIKKEDGTTLMVGDFAGHKDCLLGVSTLKKKNLVSNIGVFFGPCTTWSSLYNDYSNMVEMLTEKYGKPSERIERFDSYMKPTDDGERMTKVQLDQCKYSSTFKLKNGDITVPIEHESVISCFVLLKYRDKINSEDNRKAAIEDL